MFTKFNTTQNGGEFPLVIKHLGYMLRHNISNFYAVLFLQSVFAFVMDIFLNSRRWSSILNVGGSQFVAVFYQNTHQSMLTYSLLMIFITAITMFNREERSACYAMPCTPQVETWAKGLFLLVHIAFTTFFAVLHFQAQRLIAYMVYGPENILNINFFYTPIQLLELAAALFFFGLMAAGVGHLLGALFYLKARWVLSFAGAMAVLAAGMILSKTIAQAVVAAAAAMATFYFNESNMVLFGVKCAATGLAAFALTLPVVNRGEVKRV